MENGKRLLRTACLMTGLLLWVAPALGQLADLAVNKDDGQTTAVPGTSITYTITVSNNGPDDVTGATVTDTFPPELSGVSWVCVATPGSSCSASGSGDITDTVDLLTGGSAVYTVAATILSSATGTLSNSVTVTEPPGVTDPTPGNNSATDSDTLDPQTDLSIAKLDSPDPVTAGSSLTYTVTVTNNGPSDALAVTLTDTLPSGVTFVSSTPGAPTCTELLSTVTCVFSNIVAGSDSVVIINVAVDVGTSGTITNNATATVATDLNPANNSVSEDTLVLAPTPTPTDTPTEVPTATPTDTPTETPIPPPTPTFTPIPSTFTPTPVPLKKTNSFTRPLVQAQCLSGTTPVPCNAAGITFAKGKVKLKGIKQPKTVKTRLIGEVKISRVFPAQPTLEARVLAELSYGMDPDGDCPLANTQVAAAVVATSQLGCRVSGGASNCQGNFALPTLLAPQCSDVDLIMESVRFEVYDAVAPGSLTSLIARDGLKIFPGPAQ